MYDQSVLPKDLMPVRDDLGLWQSHLYDAIVSIQNNWTPYKNPGGGAGSLKHRYFRGKRIMKAVSPPKSHCCGAVFEAFLLAWKPWMESWYETDKDLTFEQMFEIYQRFFVWEMSGVSVESRARGCADAIMKLPEWLSWFPEYDCSVERIETADVQFGDFCQIQNGESPEDGHTVIVLGKGEYKGRDVLYVWSSNLGYDQEWTYSAGQKPGHGVDYYYVDREIDGWRRKFHMARIVG